MTPTGFKYFLLIISFLGFVSSNDPIHIDVHRDIPEDGHWLVNRYCEYKELIQELRCGADIPKSELSGQLGFWTECSSSPDCYFKYTISAGDTGIGIRFYQKTFKARLSYDGQNWEHVHGEGWVDAYRSFRETDKNFYIRMNQDSKFNFVVMDRIVVNGELPPLNNTVTPTTQSPTEATTPSCPEPCNCCDRCGQANAMNNIHYHYHYPADTEQTNK